MSRPFDPSPRPWEAARDTRGAAGKGDHPPTAARPSPGPPCDRCGRETAATILSMFNTEEPWLECKEREERHPRYEEARRAEAEAVRRGELDFPGIGRPEDL